MIIFTEPKIKGKYKVPKPVSINTQHNIYQVIHNQETEPKIFPTIVLLIQKQTMVQIVFH